MARRLQQSQLCTCRIRCQQRGRRFRLPFSAHTSGGGRGGGGGGAEGEEEEEGVYETGCSDSYALHLANIKPAGRERPCRSGKRTLDVAVAQDGSPESGPRETKGGFCLGPWPWPYMAKVSAALDRKAAARPEKPPRASFAGSATPFEKKGRGEDEHNGTRSIALLYGMPLSQ